MKKGNALKGFVARDKDVKKFLSGEKTLIVRKFERLLHLDEPVEKVIKRADGSFILEKESGKIITFFKSEYRMHEGSTYYVREAFQKTSENEYIYKADGHFEFIDTWKSAMHMPSEAARIFFRISDVDLKRLSSLTIEDIRKTGESSMQDFQKTWNSVLRTPKEKEELSFDKNPWAWIIKFEKLEI